MEFGKGLEQDFEWNIVIIPIEIGFVIVQVPYNLVLIYTVSLSRPIRACIVLTLNSQRILILIFKYEIDTNLRVFRSDGNT